MNNENGPRKRYDEAFKRPAVERWLKGDKSADQVAAELGVNLHALKMWKQRLGVVPSQRTTPPTMDELQAENQRLRRELQSVIRPREILKGTLGILSSPSEPGSKE